MELVLLPGPSTHGRCRPSRCLAADGCSGTEAPRINKPLLALTPRRHPGHPLALDPRRVSPLFPRPGFGLMCDTPPDYSPAEATPLASPPSVHSSPALPGGSVPATDVASATSRQAAAPTTPPWLLGNDAPSPQACPSTDACLVCLCEFPSHAHGPETPFLWPGCGHALHLGCVAHLVANVRELRCPTCRAPWPPSAAEAFTGACRTHGVPAPQPAPDHDTPRASTTKPLHPDPQPTSCRSVARGSFWRTRRMLPRMLLGKSYLTGTCTGRPSTHGKLAAGRPSGFARAAIPASMNTTRCCKACRHRPPAPRTVLAGSPSTCASSAADGCVAAGPLLRFSRALAKGCRSPTHRMPHLLAQVPDRPTRRRRLHRTMRRGTTRAHRADSTTGEHTAGCLCRHCMPLWAASTPPR